VYSRAHSGYNLFVLIVKTIFCKQVRITKIYEMTVDLTFIFKISEDLIGSLALRLSAQQYFENV
jgi:hypothetical protein